MRDSNLQTEWTALLVKSLADAGVTDVVISPGSRSTPLVVAAVREKRLVRHSVIDERAAGFFALGQARITGRPSVLICTSGTAVSHYLPAIIEANLTGIPMIVLSADRPPEHYDCGSPQTIDQVKLFGEHARQFFDLSPHGGEDSLRSLRRVAAQAVLGSMWPRAGAVHINARARKPLEPVEASQPAELELAEQVRAIGREPMIVSPPPRLVPAGAAIEAATLAVRGATRGVIVVGPAGAEQRASREAIWALAQATGFALACETTSQLRFGPKPAGVVLLDAFDLLLSSAAFRASSPFDLAVQIGAPPTSGAWERASSHLARVVLTDHGWPDPHNNARVLVFGDIAASCNSLASALADSPPANRIASGFRERLAALNAAAWEAATKEIAATSELSEAVAVRTLVEKAPESSVLVVGNSLAVRIIDIYARATDRDVRVLSQRGASGIDGLVAGAAGAADASRAPLLLLIGDISFHYDLTSLAIAARARTPIVVLVLNNGGGRIFDQLPIVNVPGIETAIIEHATTPHQTDFAPAAALYGVRHTVAGSAREVAASLDEAYAHQGCTIVEVRVPSHGAIALSRRTLAAVDRAVVAFLGDRR